MTYIIRLFVCIACFQGTTIISQAQGWRGIVPLHSTRGEVEAVIGPPMQPQGITYDLKSERANVTYSKHRCDNSKVEWDVPPNTVLGITIYPKTELKILDLRMDLDKFEKFTNPHNPDFVSYNDNERGISITSKKTGEILVIEYFPAAKDSHLRCPNFSPHELSNNELAYYKFDQYSDLSFADEKARLDNFADRLRKQPNFKGYIIVYPGTHMPPADMQARAKRARNYLVKTRGISADRVITVNGASREKFKVELYALPTSLSPSAINPTRDN
jgi:hypothetical protein